MTTAIKRIRTRDELIALANQLGVRPDWHEPGEQEVTAKVDGTEFDTAGNWGTSEIEYRRRVGQDSSTGLEMWVTLSQDGEPVGEVSLAMLFAFATGFDG
jgi:hypothetical protein